MHKRNLNFSIIAYFLLLFELVCIFMSITLFSFISITLILHNRCEKRILTFCIIFILSLPYDVNPFLLKYCNIGFISITESVQSVALCLFEFIHRKHFSQKIKTLHANFPNVFFTTTRKLPHRFY